MKKFAVAVLFAAFSTGAMAAPLATTTFTGDAAFLAATEGEKAVAEFRWGNDAASGDWEVALGFPTSTSNQVQAQHNWSGGESFKLNYDGAGSLVLDFNGTSSFLTYAIDTTGFNALALRADGRRGDATISNLQFDGMGFGPLLADDVVSYILLTGVDVTGSWMLSGDINFAHSDTDQANRGSQPSFQVKLVEVEAIPLPAAVWSLLAALGGLGLIGRRRRADAA